MRNAITEYFYNTRLGRNGTTVLLVFCNFLCAYKTTAISIFIQSENTLIINSSFLSNEKEKYTHTFPLIAENQFSTKRDSLNPDQLFPFNPNVVTGQELQEMGLPERVIATMLRFREKGGTFRKAEDLSRIYGLSAADFLSLQPFVRLNEASSSANQLPSNIQQPTVDINTATEEEWQKLYGIGPSFAKRIVSFREKLGGFVSVEQVGTTYGLPPETFTSVKPYLKPSPIFRPLKINSLTLEELKAHPLLRWKHAQVIVNYRKQHGAYHNMQELSRVKNAVPLDLLQQLEPYLSFEK